MSRELADAQAVRAKLRELEALLWPEGRDDVYLGHYLLGDEKQQLLDGVVLALEQLDKQLPPADPAEVVTPCFSCRRRTVIIRVPHLGDVLCPECAKGGSTTP